MQVAVPAGDCAWVWLFEVDEWVHWRDQAACLIAPDELVRASSKRNVRDKHALVVTYALHRLVLSVLMRCEPELVPIHRDDKGCPRLQGDLVYTSLSHAAGRIVIAACGVGPIGIDIEPAASARHMEEIVDRVVHGNERRRVLELPPAFQACALLDLWVRKESILKATGMGLECGMHTFEAPQDELLRLPAGRHSGSHAVVSMIDVGAEWSMAVARPAGIDIHFISVAGKQPNFHADGLNSA